MTLVLNGPGTVPTVPVKTLGIHGLPDVQLGDYAIPMKDFCVLAKSVLTNKELDLAPLIEVRTLDIQGFPDVQLCEYAISMEDFCTAVYYVLTNTDLAPNDPRLELVERVKKLDPVPGLSHNDPRLELVERVKKLNIVDGYNRGKKRLA